MKKKMAIVGAMVIAMLFSQQAMAQGSAQHSGKAVGHSALAAGHSAVGSAKLTSAAVAVPLVAVGAVGAVSAQAGNALLKAANKPIGEPLEISDEAITVGPSPDRAIR
ncbi:hypothetical protein [Mariprofundus sp. KV]|uniref:hypothetical protein n=1 Tax=Mariprofundus sp. KV TaxID=2608715 RepID=UPI0015A2D56B|nr:hypothetical protein [Mariprofundus sp. KV]NWF36982.1 hypothetical protein [Mariprofundus sp. KV]